MQNTITDYTSKGEYSVTSQDKVIMSQLSGGLLERLLKGSLILLIKIFIIFFYYHKSFIKPWSIRTHWSHTAWHNWYMQNMYILKITFMQLSICLSSFLPFSQNVFPPYIQVKKWIFLSQCMRYIKEICTLMRKHYNWKYCFSVFLYDFSFKRNPYAKN